MSSELPEGWAVRSIGSLFDCWGGMTPSTGVDAYWGGSIPWVSSKDVKGWTVDGATERITRKAVDETTLRQCPVGSVLMVVRSGVLAHTLPVAQTTVPLVINQDVKAFNAAIPDLNRWLVFYLRCNERAILDANRKEGTTVQSIRLEELLEREVPFPPLNEQHRIAAKIEKLIPQVQNIKTRLERASDEVSRFRQAVVSAACSGELTSDWREVRRGIGRSRDVAELLSRRRELWNKRNAGKRARKYPLPFEPEVPEIQVPDTWSWVSVSHLALLDVGFAFKSSEFADRGVRLLRGENIEPGSLRWAETRFWPKSKLKEFRHLLVDPGEIILALDRPIVSAGLKIARVKPTDVPALLVQRVMRFKMVDDSDTDFLHCCLSDRRFIDFLAHQGTTGSDLPHITGTGVAEFPIPLPPKDEQLEINRRVSNLLNIAEAIESRIGKVREKAELLPESIFAKAFSGEFVPTEAELSRVEKRSFEDAEVLLQRAASLKANKHPVKSRRARRS